MKVLLRDGRIFVVRKMWFWNSRDVQLTIIEEFEGLTREREEMFKIRDINRVEEQKFKAVLVREA